MDAPIRSGPAAAPPYAAPSRTPSAGTPDRDPGSGEAPALKAGAAPVSSAWSEPPADADELPPPPQPAVRPSLPGYELLDEVGAGGMGVVYRARDTALDRDVAVKLLRDAFPADSVAAKRFLDEARITGQLQHPGIPPVHRAGILSDGRPFLAMKLIRGRTLAEQLGGRPDPAADRGHFVAVFEHVCQAMAYAHAVGVIHRDLKPQNVMVGAFGEVQVMDWGLAKVVGPSDGPEAGRRPPGPAGEAGSGADPGGTTDWGAAGDGSATRSGTVLGTPAYMAPEQARGEVDRLDARADVFGLGAILCQILTGRPPFAGQDALTVLRQAAAGDLTGLDDRLAGCGADPDLVALCRRCLAADPVDRPADGGAVATAVAALRAAADERARRAELDRVRAEADRAKVEAEAREQRKRRRAQLALVGTVLAAVGLAGVGGWYLDRQRASARHQRAVHEERVRLGVHQALARLPELHRLGLWDQADQSLAEAEQLLGPDDDPALAAAVAAARRDTAFVRRQDQIRLEKLQVIGRGIDWDAAVPKYVAAFAEYGLDVRAGDPAALVDAIRASPVRDYLIAALDDWALTGGRADGERIFALTAEVTGHEWRREVPGVIGRGPVLAALFDRIPDDQRGPAVISTLGYRLELLGIDGLRRVEDGLRRHPADMWLHYYRGAICYRRWSRGGNRFDDPYLDRSAEAFRAALALRPGTPPILRQFAMSVYVHSLPQAEAALEEAIRLEPDYAVAHHTLAHLLRNAKPDRALAAAREAVRLAPNLGAAYKELGLLLRMKSDLSGAEAALREAARLDPNDRFHQGDLGMLLVERGKPDEAVGPLRAALRLDPKLTYARENLGAALRALGDPAGAIAVYREAIPFDSKDPWPHNRIGDTRRDQGDFDGAAAAYWEAIRRNPKDPHAHHHLSNCHRAKGDPQGAVAAARAALRLDQSAAYAYHNLGDALVHVRDWAEAAAAFRRAIVLDGKHAWSHANLGTALRHLGDLDGAAAACRQALRLDAGLTAARDGLAEAERWHGYQKRLPALLAGTDRPGSPAEALAVADFCRQPFNRHYRLAFDLYRGVYLAARDVTGPWQPYPAAGAAVQLAAGNDLAGPVGADEGYYVQALALRWLTADLAAQRAQAGDPARRPAVRDALKRWKADPDLAAVRDPAWLAVMPADDRKRWEALWADVDALLGRVGLLPAKAGN